jgi:hypothetical protein
MTTSCVCECVTTEGQRDRGTEGQRDSETARDREGSRGAEREPEAQEAGDVQDKATRTGQDLRHGP